MLDTRVPAVDTSGVRLSILRWIPCLLVGPAMVVSQLPEQTDMHYFPLSDVVLGDGPFLHARNVDRQYLRQLEPDRLLAGFLIEAGLEPKAEKYPNWESGGLDGHTAGHYLTALAQMAATGDEGLRERLVYIVAELARCQEAHGNGYVGAIPGGRALWKSVRSGEFEVDDFSLNGAWVPWYNLHKLFAGLRDAYRIAGVEQARDVLVRLTDWCAALVEPLSEAQTQAMLRAEHGGMNEVLADVFAITGDRRYLRLARRFSHQAVLRPLANRRDELTGLHANTQIPKVIGFARIAELSGRETGEAAATFFWNRVVEERSVAFGGNSAREHFHDPNDFSPMVRTPQGPETCNTYNMLRLTEQLYRTGAEGRARLADYYERALYNHILSSQHPEHGGFVYFTPIRPRHYRVYSQPDSCFWCCVGSGMENHGKYGRFIYAHADDALHVNLFIASELKWVEKGISVRQKTRFPDEPATRLEIIADRPTRFTLHMRHPAWAAEGFRIRVNGEPWPDDSSPSSYVAIERRWRTGDVVEVDLPMTTRLERLPDGSDYVAVLHGPIVLAAKTGTRAMPGLVADDSRMGHVAAGRLLPLEEAPMLVGDPDTAAEAIVPVPGESLTFAAPGLIRPESARDLELVPFFRVHDARYMLYWRMVPPGE